jgi:SAM-dependent methyltransferase
MQTQKSKKKRRGFTKANSNKHDLYERSVQDPPSDVRFIHRVFKKERGKTAMSLREDFCGTGAMCASWVASNKERVAVGLDLDQPTMDWGMERHILPLGKAAERVTLLNRNVLTGTPRQKFDTICAFNFSYCVFKDRNTLLDYMKGVRRDLKPGGAFFMDLHGGPDAQIEVEERTKIDGGFTYVWDQRPMDAVTACAVRYIHFEFRDGSAIRRAFTYDWRVWSLPELRDLMLAAGFKAAEVYWEGCDQDGDGNGIFRKVKKAENEESWVAYLCGWR